MNETRGGGVAKQHDEHWAKLLRRRSCAVAGHFRSPPHAPDCPPRHLPVRIPSFRNSAYRARDSTDHAFDQRHCGRKAASTSVHRVTSPPRRPEFRSSP